MISIIAILYLMFIHWVGDFLFQTPWMGENKSKNFKALVTHTTVYTLIMMFGSVYWLEFSISDIFMFGLITFACHTITDFFSSKLTSKQFSNKIYNGFSGGFTIIGMDQYLHLMQIILTYKYLTD